MNKGVLFLTLVAVATLVSNSHATNFQVRDQTIVQLRTYATYAVVEYEPGVTNNLACAGKRATVRTHAAITFGDDANIKVIYAAALAAMVNGSTVSFGIQDTRCANFDGGIPNIYRLDVMAP